MADITIEQAFEDDSLTNIQILDMFPQYSYDQIQRGRAKHRREVGLPPLKRGRKNPETYADIEGINMGDMLRDFENDDLSINDIVDKWDHPQVTWDWVQRRRKAHRDSLGLSPRSKSYAQRARHRKRNRERREALRQETLKTADNYNQPWTFTDDQAVLTRTWNDDTDLDDVTLAVHLGRTQTAVSQRRVVLHKLFEQGMTLKDIHRAEQVIQHVRQAMLVASVMDVCPECFCNPHTPGCPNE